MQDTMDSADALNQGCVCCTLDAQQLNTQLESDPSLAGLSLKIAQTRPHLFSSTVVFLSQAMHDTIVAAVAAIERVTALPAYQNAALGRASAIAQHQGGPAGVYMGYDFHVSASGPKLIEINTNAGGALLNAVLARAQRACCDSSSRAFAARAMSAPFESVAFDMFRSEWRAQRGQQPLRSVVIVDDNPKEQYLWPEFELHRHLFLQRGIQASIADPRELTWRDAHLWHGDTAVDMVYNRLTDFYLAEANHEALHTAYGQDAIVMTPHPRAHALMADKRNLIALSDDAQLAAWGVHPTDRLLLAAAVPPSHLVTMENAHDLWAQRRQLFFKPVAGHGAKAVYRGDKLTKKVWDDIVSGLFIAQALVPPARRMVIVDGIQTDLKFDIRAYTYRGQVQLLAARTYQGQTTNFRTPGGGFSPVVVVPQLGSMAKASPAHVAQSGSSQLNSHADHFEEP